MTDWSNKDASEEALAAQQRIGGWFVTAFKGSTGRWWGMAKQSPFIIGGLVTEPGVIWAELGDSRDEAIANVMRDVGVLQ